MADVDLDTPPAVLKVELKNTKPVELIDLTTSLTALGQSYEDFVHSHGYDPVAGNVRLYIKELRGGSIIAELAAMMDQASFIVEHADTFAGFVAHLNELTAYFLGQRTAKPIEPTKKEAERFSQIIEPVAKDGGANFNMNIQGGTHRIEVHFHMPSERANAAQNGVRRFLGNRPPVTGVHHDQLLTLAQVRGDTKARAGDFGVIEQFSDKPVKLRFASEEVKASLLEVPHPFDMVFVVDCEVMTVEGKPAQYKIYVVKDAFPKPA